MNKLLLYFLIIFLLSCLSQVASDIYLPALPIISQEMHTTTHTIQLSIAIYFYGFASSHLIYGPLSDSIGRRKPLIIGTLICIIGCLLCQFATSIVIFNISRFIQGLGAGASAVIYRSILRDRYTDTQLAKVSSFLGIGRIGLLACSPLIGAYLLHFFNWRASFSFLVIYSALCLLGTIFFLQETNEHMHPNNFKLSYIIKNTWTLLISRTFMGYALCIMLTFGGILAWLTTLPIVLQKVIGLSPIAFAWLAALAGLFFAVGGFINALFIKKLGINTMLFIGAIIMLISGGIMLTLGLLGFVSTFAIMLPVITFITGSSLIFPNAYAGAFNHYSEISGTASATFGLLQTLGGAISSTIISYTHSFNQIPLAITLIASSILTCLCILLVIHTQTEAKGPALRYDVYQN